MALQFDFVKAPRVDGSAFHPGSGGGGGSFYMARQEQPEEEEKREEEDATTLAEDACDFNAPVASRLSLWLDDEPEVDLDALGLEIKDRVRYLKLAMAHLERTLDRRTSAMVGSVTVYRSA